MTGDPASREADAVDVVVPTFRRPDALRRCLAALAVQEHAPARVLVVVRADDFSSQRVVDEARTSTANVEVVTVGEPGVIAAMSAGVAATTAPIVAFTDDDAEPRPDWLARVVRHFEDPAVGGVGGRDLVPGQTTPLAEDVGRFERWGRLVGNHHLGTGPARDVDVVKGVNMAFRADALALPAAGVLRGRGAQVDFEVLVSTWARRRGWRLLYDPAIVVDHEGAARTGDDARGRPRWNAVYDAGHNAVAASALLERGLLRRRLAFGVAVGTRDRPGVVRAVAAAVRREPEVVRRTLPALAGSARGLVPMPRRRRDAAHLVVSALELRATRDASTPSTPTPNPGRLLAVSHPSVVGVNQLPYVALQQQGWVVDVVVPARWRHEYAASDFAPDVQPALAGRVHPLPVVGAGRPQRHAYLRSARAQLHRFRPDVVFLEQEPFSVAALQWSRAARRAGIPFGVQLAENLDRSFNPVVRWWRGRVLRHAAFVAARSPAAAVLARQWGARGTVAVVTHHVPGWPAPERVVAPAFRVGYAGRLVPEKGLDILVAAVRALDAPSELVVVGDGPLRQWLHDQDLGRARLRLLTDVTHDGMDRAYAEMDVLVLPSRTTPTWAEQFGRVVVEALWCGVPVVGSDSGEIPWVIESTGGGRVVPEGDAAALTHALDELRRDPDARAEYARVGGRAARDRFSTDASARALEQLLVDAMPARRTSRGADDARPRVALVAHGIHDRGGMERACAELVRRTHEQYRYVAVTADLDPELRPLVEHWVRIRVPARPIPLKFAAFFARAGRALRRLDVDLVHSVGAIVPNRVDVVAVHYCHAGARRALAGSADERPGARRVNTRLASALAIGAERWCYRPGRVRRFVTVSAGVGEEVAAHYPGAAITWVPNGVDRERFHPDPDARSRLRAEVGVDDTTMVALFVGGDWVRKGLAVAIEALAKATAAGSRVELWVVGRGDVDRARARAEVSGVGPHVRFFGMRTDTPDFYRAADVFVFPTAYEAFSLAMLEAAASGLPLVVPPVNGAAELVVPGETGLVAARSADAFGDALGVLAAQPEVRTRLGRNAATRSESFTWARAAAETAAVYEDLLGRVTVS